MLRLNQAVIPLAGLLLMALSPAARAQSCKCRQTPPVACSCPQTPPAACKCRLTPPEPCSCPQTAAQEPSAPREKPYAEDANPARSVAAPDSLVYREEMSRSERAAQIVNRISVDTIRDAKAIAVIPGVKKAEFVFGSRWGKGLLTRRDE